MTAKTMTKEEAATQLTPLMAQYQNIKAQHRESILLFRLGDFYEIFGDEAKMAAPVLEVVLTSRNDIPMCGVPHHAVNSYIFKLLKAGHKVAIAEQMEDPAEAKGVVRREVVRIITPGTVLEEEMLEAKVNNFLTGVTFSKDGTSWGLATVDVSTGEFRVCEIHDDVRRSLLAGELSRLKPAEVIAPETFTGLLNGNLANASVVKLNQPVVPGSVSEIFSSVFGTQSAHSFGLTPDSLAFLSVNMVLEYVASNEPQALRLIKRLNVYNVGEYLCLDANVVRHLDLFSLLKVIDETVTAAGARKLRAWLIRPLTNVNAIRNRQSCVEELVKNQPLRYALRPHLHKIGDIERILAKINVGKAGGRDFLALKNAAVAATELNTILLKAVENRDSPHFPEFGEMGTVPIFPLGYLREGLVFPQDITDLLERSIADEPSSRPGEPGVIREGYSVELDEMKKLSVDGKSCIAALQAKERERTGIASLKVGYNDIFGYYLEVTRTNLSRVPAEWLRKQTLANAERYITSELKEWEEKILSAQQKAGQLEAILVKEIQQKIMNQAGALQLAAERIAELDVLTGFGECAAKRGYVKPLVDESAVINICAGRHPVMETLLPPGQFIPNDINLNDDDCQIMLITGPNMSGKSTYLRQIGLLTIMAQAGSFIPAAEARIGIRDRIFTRIGADDRILEGASTFMVEMQEVAAILNLLSSRSLTILDEVGRGTSTYDGVAIAWAVVEYMARFLPGPKVIFATHYFELTKLARALKGVANFHAAAKEWSRGDGRRELVFLHQILLGPADRSYGLHVAEMAGVPLECVNRARQIMESLEAKHSRPVRLEQSNGARPLGLEKKGRFDDIRNTLEEYSKQIELF